MLRFVYIILFFVFVIAATGEYKYVKIDFSNETEFQSLLNSGIDLQNAVIKDNSHIILIINDNEFIELSKQFRIEILQDNYEQFLIDKYKIINKNQEILQSGKYFKLGSYAGHFTIQEIEENFNLMMEKFPKYISKIEIGKSINEKSIFAYCFGPFGCMGSMSHPEVLINGVHHAREPIGATLIVYAAWKLLELMESNDTEIMYLLNNRNIVFLPILNPDGYEINYTKSPTGGGLWRKNARIIEGEVMGVDLNRNYGPQEYWNYDGQSDTKLPIHETYPGPNPFSEPETQAMKSFLDMHNFKYSFNYHTYSNLLIYPYNHRSEECADSAYFRDFSNYISRKNNYVYGTASRILNYTAQGGADDYLWGTKGIYSYTVEVGNDLDGFYTRYDSIIPYCEQNFEMIKQVIWSGASNLVVKDVVYNWTDNNSMQLKVTIQNLGTETSDVANFSIEALNQNVEIFDKNRIIEPIDKGGEISLIIYLQNNAKIENGIFVDFQTMILENGVFKKDTFSVQYYHPIIEKISFDEKLSGFEFDENWWSYYDETEHDFIISSNFNNKYPDSVNSVIQFPSYHIDGSHLTLEFTAKWAVEVDYDFIELQIFNYQTGNWDNLRTNRMNIGLGIKDSRQEIDKSGFHGYMPLWTVQDVNLDVYKNDSIKIRFVLKTDGGTNYEGFRVKDIKYKLYKDESSVVDVKNDNISIYPNPAKVGSIIRLMSNIDLSDTSIIVTNILGEEVYKTTNGKNEVHTNDFSSGIYFIKLEKDGKFIDAKLLRILN